MKGWLLTEALPSQASGLDWPRQPLSQSLVSLGGTKLHCFKSRKRVKGAREKGGEKAGGCGGGQEARMPDARHSPLGPNRSAVCASERVGV